MCRLKQIWRSWPLRVKLVLLTTVLVVLVAVSITALFIFFEQRAFRADLEQQAEILLDTLEAAVVDALYQLDADHLSDLMEALGEDRIVASARVYDQKGRIIADAYSEELTYRLEDDLFGRQLIESEATVFVWQADQLLAGRAVVVGPQRLGAVSVGLSMAPLKTQVVTMRDQGLTVVLAAIAVGTLLALWVSRSITYKLHEMVEATEDIASGDLSRQVPVRGSDELAVLAEAFNRMTAQLQHVIQSLEQRTSELEASRRLTYAVSELSKVTLDPELLLREAVRLLQTRFDLFQVCIYLLSGTTRNLVLYAAASRTGEVPDEHGYTISLDDERSVVARAARDQQAALIQGVAPRACSEVLVPLIIGGRLLGVLHVQDDHLQRFSQADLETFSTLAGQIATTLDNALLFEQLYAAKEAAEAASRTKSTFLANISHELHTPLTSVLGFAKVSKKRLEGVIFPAVVNGDNKVCRAVERVGANMDIIVAEGERLTALINDVLDLAKIEAGKIEWNMRPVLVQEIVEQATEATAWLFENKPLDSVLEVEEGLPPILGDYDRLIQVMVNLISNAVKFTDKGRVTCRVSWEGDEIVVSVIDTGVGVAPGDYDKVFDPFVQAGDALTDKPRGTGLGLPICKYIVERHGGRIWVESEGVPGRGSCFTFTLPISTSD